METEVILTAEAPIPGGAYSQAIRAGEVIFLAGQVGRDPATGDTCEGVAAQTRQALHNLEAVLVAAGGSLSQLVKTTCFLTSISDFAEFNAAYEDEMSGHKPARSTVGVQLATGLLVEIEGVAVLG